MKEQLKKYIGQRSWLRITYHHAKAFVAALRYGFPARKLSIIGITGTDGKTTTVGMTAHILHEAGVPVAALSTAFFRIKDQITWNETEKTSPNPFVIQQFLRKALRNKCTTVVMEVSSHGLVQGRVNYTWPVTAAITNISMEHLDYHGTMKQYIADKGLLFRKHLKKNGTAILNGNDDTYAVYSKYNLKNNTTYGNSNTSQYILNISNEQSDGKTTSCSLYDSNTKQEHLLTLQIAGLYNLQNAACALLCAQSNGVSVENGITHLSSFTNASGRMEKIDEGQPFDVFIDFTVTPNAFKKTLTTLNSMKDVSARTLVLTGSCGDRMKEKRPIIGKICSEMADVVVITDDEPYTEDPLQIIEEVWSGIDQSQCEAHKIVDRTEAIQKIMSLAKEGDAVLLCGMGSYPSRWTKDGPVPWNEQEITRAALRHLS